MWGVCAEDETAKFIAGLLFCLARKHWRAVIADGAISFGAGGEVTATLNVDAPPMWSLSNEGLPDQSAEINETCMEIQFW